VREHEYEPIRGLPEVLPPGEAILWQGAPDREVMARRALHIRTLGIYFALLSVTRGVATAMDGVPAASAAIDALWLAAPAAVTIAILYLFAVLWARTTVYTVTNRRLVMRIGVALSMTLNIPFNRIEAAAVKVNPDGSGDLSLRLAADNNIAYALLWPHARPWHLSKAEPTLRAILNVEHVAQTLARALAASAAMPAPAMVPPRGYSPTGGSVSQTSAAVAV